MDIVNVDPEARDVLPKKQKQKQKKLLDKAWLTVLMNSIM